MIKMEWELSLFHCNLSNPISELSAVAENVQRNIHTHVHQEMWHYRQVCAYIRRSVIRWDLTACHMSSFCVFLIPAEQRETEMLVKNWPVNENLRITCKPLDISEITQAQLVTRVLHHSFCETQQHMSGLVNHYTHNLRLNISSHEAEWVTKVYVWVSHMRMQSSAEIISTSTAADINVFAQEEKLNLLIWIAGCPNWQC